MEAMSDTGGDLVCLYLDDFCEEVIVDDGEDEEQGSCSQASAQSGRKRGTKSTTSGVPKAKGSSKRKRKTLNKDETASLSVM